MDWKKKLTSRKLWVAVAGFVSGLVLAFKGSAELAETISGCVMAAASVVAYIVGEGLTDAAHSKDATADSNTEADKKDKAEEPAKTDTAEV